jgi:glycosyltransferase involved in cell wall biosynthesis
LTLSLHWLVAVRVMLSVWYLMAGLSAVEQMMRGTVVVVADIGGVSEIVGDVGLKFPPSDACALHRCLKAILGDLKRVDRLPNRPGDALSKAIRSTEW